MNNNGNSHIVPFGKYKGQPMEILANDPSYVEWLNGQGWVKDKYPQFYTVIINNFQEPSDTPEHNALQALFLDDEFCIRFVNAVMPSVDASETTSCHTFLLHSIHKKYFEVDGIDVLLTYRTWGFYDSWGKHPYSYHPSCKIEIKPSIGDDFPSVLRQAQRMKNGTRCVVFRDFVGTSVTLEQVRAMFKHSGVLLFSLDEIQQAPAAIYPDVDSLPKQED